MNLSSVITLSYAILLIIGGVMGYIKAGSFASLVMGTLFGCALLGCYWASYRQVSGSKTMTLALLGILTGFFGYRLAVTGSFFPAGALLALSIVAILVQLRGKNCCTYFCKNASTIKP
jgi:uncharacterized membrane protein (UPF0136 family)